MDKKTITINVRVQVPIDKVWEYWTKPEHIINWNFASDEWHTPSATNDLRPEGRFSYRMEAKDGSMGFDLEGTYTEIENEKKISSILDDKREVNVEFKSEENNTLINESFEAENTHSIEMQRDGWQEILNNFKKYAESTYKNAS